MIFDMMVKLGIPTYTDTYYTMLNGTQQVKIGQDMPTPVGYIYGLSTITNGTEPMDNTKNIISTANAAAIWLYLKIGTNLFQNNFRLDKLIFEESGGTQYNNPRRYFPVSVPALTDLKESYYQNPSAIGSVASPLFVALQIHYIDKESYEVLVQKKYLFKGAQMLPANPMYR